MISSCFYFTLRAIFKFGGGGGGGLGGGRVVEFKIFKFPTFVSPCLF